MTGMFTGRTVLVPLREEDIAKRAFAIWQRNGCPEGTDKSDWEQAKQELEQEDARTLKACMVGLALTVGIICSSLPSPGINP